MKQNRPPFRAACSAVGRLWRKWKAEAGFADRAKYVKTEPESVSAVFRNRPAYPGLNGIISKRKIHQNNRGNRFPSLTVGLFVRYNNHAYFYAFLSYLRFAGVADEPGRQKVPHGRNRPRAAKHAQKSDKSIRKKYILLSGICLHTAYAALPKQSYFVTMMNGKLAGRYTVGRLSLSPVMMLVRCHGVNEHANPR